MAYCKLEAQSHHAHACPLLEHTICRTIYRTKVYSEKLVFGVVLSLTILLLAGLAYSTVSRATKTRRAAAKKRTVVMTRTTQNINIANSASASIANNARAGLFIRLHCDGSSSGSTHGISTLVPGTNQWTGPIVGASAVAGRRIQQALVSATGASSRGVIARSDLSGFNYCKVPVVLVEMGFMTNAAEDRNLNSAAYQQRLVNGFVQGVLAYFKR